MATPYRTISGQRDSDSFNLKEHVSIFFVKLLTKTRITLSIDFINLIAFYNPNVSVGNF